MGGMIFGGCLLEGEHSIWRSSIMEDDRANRSMVNCHITVRISFETLDFVYLYSSLK